MATLVTAVTSTPAFLASCDLGAVFVEARHGEEAVARNVRRVVHGDEAIGVAGIADDEHAHVARRRSSECAWPWPMKILPLMPSRSLRSMPALRGTLPTSSAQFTPRKPSSRLAVATTPLSSGKRAVVQFHHHALERRQGRLDFDEVQDDRLVRPEHRAGGDAEQEGITDLAGGAGDGDTNGGSAHKKSTGSMRVRFSSAQAGSECRTVVAPASDSHLSLFKWQTCDDASPAVCAHRSALSTSSNSAGSRRLELQFLPRTRMDERQLCACSITRGVVKPSSSASAPVLPLAVGRVADDGKAEVLEVHADLVRAAGVQARPRRAWLRAAVRARGSRCAPRGRCRPGPPCVCDATDAARWRRGFRLRRAAVRRRRWRDKSSPPVRPANCAESARCVSSFLATTRQPLVSLSSRWTMPGRATPPMPLSCPAQ